MIRYVLILLAIAAFYQTGGSQHKADYHWFFGYDFDGVEPFKYSALDFNEKGEFSKALTAR